MVEASSYHHQEDEPNMSDPDVALDMYKSQKASLPTLEQVLSFVNRIEGQLGEIYNYATENNLPDLAGKAAKSWEKVQQLHQHIQRQDAVQRGGEAVVEAVQEQRDEVLSELADLKNALDDMDEEHPLLETFAQAVRENQMEMDADSEYEWQEEATFDGFREGIGIALKNIQIPPSRAEYYADRLMEIFTSPVHDFNEAQAAIVKQLCETFPLPEYVLLFETAQAEARKHGEHDRQILGDVDGTDFFDGEFDDDEELDVDD